MIVAMSFILLLLVAAPQAASEAEAFVEKLGSERVEERDEASHRLRELGKAAVPVLKKAAAGADREVALRAAQLLNDIALPEPGETDLVIRISNDGKCRIQDKLFADFSEEVDGKVDLRKLEDLFESRRQGRFSGGVEAPPPKYALFVEASADVPFEYVQLLTLTAMRRGGVSNLVLVAPDIEQFLRLGAAGQAFGTDAPELPVVVEEIRVLVCAGGDDREHRNDRAGHSKRLKDSASCAVFVEKLEIGRLASGDAADRKVLTEAGLKARELAGALPAKKPPTVVLDLDEEVPFRHFLAIFKALRARGFNEIDFVVAPRVIRKAGGN